MKTLTLMAVGAANPIMAMCGIPAMFPQAGSLIGMAAGYGLSRGDGPGLTMIRGVTLRFTMADGAIQVTDGDGFPGQWIWTRCTRPLSSLSWAEAAFRSGSATVT